MSFYALLISTIIYSTRSLGCVKSLLWIYIVVGTRLALGRSVTLSDSSMDSVSACWV